MKFTLLALFLIPFLIFGQTTITFDNNANWVPGSGAINSYQVDHSYVEGDFAATSNNSLREEVSTVDGEDAVIGTYAWRMNESSAGIAWACAIANGGINNFSLKLRRFDDTPPIDLTLEYSLNGGTNWTTVQVIDPAAVNNASAYVTFNGTINSNASNISIRVIANSATERFMIDDFTWTPFSTPCVNTTSSFSETACDEYIVPSGDESYTASGIYEDTIPNAAGCDSIMTIDVTINNSTSSSFNPVACDSYTVPSGDETYTSSGTYIDTVPNTIGCDSILTINLTIRNSSTNTINPVACDTYTVPSGDETYTSTGTYLDTIPSANGCDSVLTINLTINTFSTATISETACGLYTVPSGDETYSATGTYEDTIPNAIGCDSIITINLTINPNSFATIDTMGCESYTVPSGDETYTVSGTYMDTIPANSGCDSILTINLSLNFHSSVSITESACETYTVPSGDETYTTSGMYMDTIPTVGGCDSILSINLTINNANAGSESVTACETYTVPSGDETYTVSGTYMDTIPRSNGCDSVLTITLTIINGSTATINETACETYTVPSGDETYTASGTYMDTIQAANGCDSVLTINLTIKFNSFAIIDSTVCETYTVPSTDETYTSSGTYMDTIPSANGCDSILTINLTVNYNDLATIDPIACISYTVPSGDETYSASGTYMDTIPTAEGCDSVLTINLTISNSVPATFNTFACDTYTVPSGDETYTSSGTYMDTIPTVGGCDSILTINLNVQFSSSNSITEVVCDTYTVPSGDETYTTSGTYMDTIPNANGCDSILTINLTVNYNQNLTLTETACLTYTVPSGDETYTTSGTYMDTIPTTTGCDSIFTINLTIQNASSNSFTTYSCGPYTVPSGDETYGASGTYMDTILNAVGCDSVLTISLTVGPASGSSHDISGCDSAQYQGTYYYNSGTYTFTEPSVEGCDSIITIYATISKAPITPVASGGASICFGGTRPTMTVVDDTLPDLIITGVFSGPASFGRPKMIEVFATKTITNLTAFGFGSANDGAGSDGQEFTLPGMIVNAGTFLRITANPQLHNFYFSEPADIIDSSAAGSAFLDIDGNDAIELYFNGEVIDVFGEIDNSGFGSPWDYSEGWAYRKNHSLPNTGNFDPSNWNYSGAGANAGATSNNTSPSPIFMGAYYIPIADQFTWYLESSLTTVIGNQNSQVALSSDIGTKYYYVTNKSGICHSKPDSVAVTVLENPEILDVVVSNVTSDPANGAIDLTVGGGLTPYTYDWSNAEITEDLMNLEDGEYDVIVTDANGCIVTSESYEVKRTVAELDEEGLVQVIAYPNPSSAGFYNLQFNTAMDADLKVLDMNGRLIQSIEHHGVMKFIDLSNYADGSYHLVIETEFGMKNILLMKR